MASFSLTEAADVAQPEADVLIVGGDSLIGGHAARLLARAGLTVHATTRRPDGAFRSPDRPFVDLAARKWAALDGNRYRTAVLCAAVARLADCRRDPAGTAAVNVTGTVALARRLAEQRTRVLFLSTNQVFDGTAAPQRADAPPNPVTEYGRQKTAAEAGILELPGAAVLRLTKVVHPGMALFDGWAADLRAGRPIAPFGDFRFAPVEMGLVAETILRLCSLGAADMAGIWQLSAPADITYADAAHHIAERLGCDTALVQPVFGAAAGALGGDLPPPFSALDSGRICDRLGLAPPDAATAVASCLASAIPPEGTSR